MRCAAWLNVNPVLFLPEEYQTLKHDRREGEREGKGCQVMNEKGQPRANEAARRKGALRVWQSKYFSPTSRWRSSIPSLLSSTWAFFCSRSPRSSTERFRFWGVSSPMGMSCDMSDGWEALPFTLCAGVGRVVVMEVRDVFMLEAGSEMPGDSCEGL